MTDIHRVAVLSKAHQVASAENPCEQPRVRELLSKTRRGYAKRGALPHKKPALTREPLEALLETCDASLTGLRDRALLLFAFASGDRRRSEVAAATLENTVRDGEHFIVTWDDFGAAAAAVSVSAARLGCPAGELAR